MDLNIHILKGRIRNYCSTGEVFNLKKLLHYYMIDVIGELAFSQSFGVQEADDELLVPPVIEHSLLAAVTGAWPCMTKTLKKWLPIVPHDGLRKLFAGRKACADLASTCVQRRLADLKGDETSSSMEDRKDILTNLIKAKHPETGERLTKIDLETEAFGFMYVYSLECFCWQWTLTTSQYRGNPHNQRYLNPLILPPPSQPRAYEEMYRRDRI